MLIAPPASEWPDGPPQPALSDHQVHVWSAALDGSSFPARAFLEILSPDELERAGRFHFEQDRNHFVIARGTLRKILSRYLGVSPQRLRFCHNSFGKPALTEDAGGSGLRFNVSHSGEQALYAIARGREVGIDIERWHEDIDHLGIAENFFSRQERDALRQLPAQARTQGFFNCWTRKEAYIKALGMGLSLPLDQFDVSLVPGEPAALLKTAHDLPAAQLWSLRELHPAHGYAAALAAQGLDWQFTCWQWSEEKEKIRTGGYSNREVKYESDG